MRQCHNKFYLLIQSALGRERKEDNEAAAAALEDVFVRFTRLQSDNLEDEDEDDVHFLLPFILRISWDCYYVNEKIFLCTIDNFEGKREN